MGQERPAGPNAVIIGPNVDHSLLKPIPLVRRMRQAAYLELLRPLNCAMAAVATAVGGVVAVGPSGLRSSWIPALLAAIVALLFTGAGNGLNDYVDRATDKINHPFRPIPTGRVQPRSALRFAAALFIGGAVIAPLINLQALGLVLLNFAAMMGYEVVFKKRGLPGNLLISYLVASLFLFGGVAVYASAANPVDALGRVLILFTLAFIATLGREVVKDIEDVAGDVDRATLPRTLGPRAAGLLASGAFVVAVGLSTLPFLFRVLANLQYVIIIAFADAIFIYCALNSQRKPRQIGRASKYAMLVALVAFLVGGLS